MFHSDTADDHSAFGCPDFNVRRCLEGHHATYVSYTMYFAGLCIAGDLSSILVISAGSDTRSEEVCRTSFLPLLEPSIQHVLIVQRDRAARVIHLEHKEDVPTTSQSLQE